MKVSILVAAYNRLDLLKQCLESARAQTYHNFELVVVNDGSTEDLSSIEGLCDVYYQFSENQGISVARNKAMELASGEYFFILDSDDIMLPNCLKEEVALIEKENADLVFCRLPIINEANSQVGEFPCRVQNWNELLICKLMPHPSSLFRKSSLQGIQYDPEIRSAVDLDFLLKFMLVKPQKIVMLHKPLYLYRTHGQGQETGTQRQTENTLKIRNKYASLDISTT